MSEAKPSLLSKISNLRKRVRPANNEDPVEAKRRKLEALKQRKQQQKRDKEEQSLSATPTGRHDVLCTTLATLCMEYAETTTISDTPIETTPFHTLWRMTASASPFILKELNVNGDLFREATEHSLPRELCFAIAAGRVGLANTVANHFEGAHRFIIWADQGATQMNETAVQSTLRNVATTIKRLHSMETTGMTNYAPSNVFSDIMCCHTALTGEDLPQHCRTPTLPEKYSDMYDTALQWMALLAEYHPDKLDSVYVCHNNLEASHFWSNENGDILLDGFEEASLGDRWYDLANCARLCKLDDAQEMILLSAYFGSLTKRQIACFKLLKTASYLKDAMNNTVKAVYLSTEDAGSTAVVEAAKAAASVSFAKFIEISESEQFIRYIGEDLVG